jgi:thiol-disulfide isomerase/thioredoxin
MRSIAALLLALLSTTTLRAAAPLRSGDPCPTFHAQDASGKEVSFTPAGESPVIVQTWASWCAPCHEAIPFLLSLARERPELSLVFVNVDADPRRSRSALPGHEGPLSPQVTLLFDPTARVLQQLRAPGMPTTVVVVRGTVRFVKVGFDAATKEQIRAALDGGSSSL